jgi:DNA-directed RNA polymerase sigma subunit (sigma70/sigma32)
MPSKGKTAKRQLRPGTIALRSLSEVAKILRLSKGQVDRLEQSAFRKLRRALT